MSKDKCIVSFLSFIGETRRTRMLFMVIERFKPGRVSELYARFRERGRMLPEGLKYLDSWVDTDRTICFQLMKAEDDRLLSKWMGNWDDLVDFEVFPVVSSTQMQQTMIDSQ